jgi:uncharacterized Zn finger protein (UPF0148 family)
MKCGRRWTAEELERIASRCPVCGSELQEDEGGRAYCPVCGWREESVEYGEEAPEELPQHIEYIVRKKEREDEAKRARKSFRDLVAEFLAEALRRGLPIAHVCAHSVATVSGPAKRCLEGELRLDGCGAVLRRRGDGAVELAQRSGVLVVSSVGTVEFTQAVDALARCRELRAYMKRHLSRPVTVEDVARCLEKMGAAVGDPCAEAARARAKCPGVVEACGQAYLKAVTRLAASDDGLDPIVLFAVAYVTGIGAEAAARRLPPRLAALLPQAEAAGPKRYVRLKRMPRACPACGGPLMPLGG